MPENRYSIRTKKLIERWGGENRNKYKFHIAKIQLKNTLTDIRSPKNRGDFINYKPDGIYTLSNKDKIVFEVLDSQIETKTIADIVRCVFHESVSDIVFIVKNNKNVRDVLRITKVILDNLDFYLNLKDTEEQKEETPLIPTVIKITETNSKSKKIFSKIFNKEMKRILED